MFCQYAKNYPTALKGYIVQKFNRIANNECLKLTHIKTPYIVLPYYRITYIVLPYYRISYYRITVYRIQPYTVKKRPGN